MRQRRWMFGRKEGDGRVYFLIAIFFDLTGLAELLGKCDSKVCSFSMFFRQTWYFFTLGVPTL